MVSNNDQRHNDTLHKYRLKIKLHMGSIYTPWHIPLFFRIDAAFMCKIYNEEIRTRRQEQHDNFWFYIRAPPEVHKIVISRWHYPVMISTMAIPSNQGYQQAIHHHCRQNSIHGLTCRCHQSKYHRKHAHYLYAYNICNVNFIRDTHTKPNKMIDHNKQYYCNTLKHQCIALQPFHNIAHLPTSLHR